MLWARLHQKASVSRGTGTVSTPVSLTLTERRGLLQPHVRTYNTLHAQAGMHTGICTVSFTVMCFPHDVSLCVLAIGLYFEF